MASEIPAAFVKRLLELEAALQRISGLARRDGLITAQRIAVAALQGTALPQGAGGPTLADPVYYAKVRRALVALWFGCAYCDARSVPLEIEHALPVSRGGGDDPQNLLLACHACNQRKGTQTLEEFGYGHLALRLAGQTLGGR
jgi:hypothetical protein